MFFFFKSILQGWNRIGHLLLVWKSLASDPIVFSCEWLRQAVASGCVYTNVSPDNASIFLSLSRKFCVHTPAFVFDKDIVRTPGSSRLFKFLKSHHKIRMRTCILAFSRTLRCAHIQWTTLYNVAKEKTRVGDFIWRDDQIGLLLQVTLMIKLDKHCCVGWHLAVVVLPTH